MKRFALLILAGAILMTVLSSCGLRDGDEKPTAPAATDPSSDTVTGTEEESATADEAVDPAEMFRGEFISSADGSATFRTDEGERTLPLDDPGFVLRNRLIEGETFEVNVSDGIVVDLSAVDELDYSCEPPVKGEPGKRTLGNFIKTALSPVGRTLYVYGGGWNWQDDGSSNEARNPALSPTWAKYFDAADASYEYEGGYFPKDGVNVYHYAGLDCSGFLGWAVYATLNAEAGGEGFVTSSTSFASSLADRGLGTVTAGTPVPTLENYRPGDIVSIKGHVFMIIGVCSDGSAVIAHSTVTTSRTGHKGGGAQISAVGYSKDCEAYAIADRFMTENYPEWNERYETDLKDPSLYFPGESGSVFTWSESVLSDPDGIRSMLPDRVLEAAKG